VVLLYERRAAVVRAKLISLKDASSNAIEKDCAGRCISLGEGDDRAAISPAAQVTTGSLLFTGLGDDGARRRASLREVPGTNERHCDYRFRGIQDPSTGAL